MPKMSVTSRIDRVRHPIPSQARPCPQSSGHQGFRYPAWRGRRSLAGRRRDPTVEVEHTPKLLLALRPHPRHRLSFPVEIRLHVRKLLDDGIDAVAEPRTGQVLIDELHLGLLALLRLTAGCDLDQRLAQSDREGNGKARLSHPDTVDQIEGFNTLGQGAGNYQGDLGLGAALVVTQFCEPAVAPILGLF